MNVGLLSTLIERVMIKVTSVERRQEEMKKFVDDLYVKTGAVAEEDGVMHAALYICVQVALEGEYGEQYTSLPEGVHRILIHAFIAEVNESFETIDEKRSFIEENFDRVDELFDQARSMHIERTERISKMSTLH